MKNTRKIGSFGEDIATKYLISLGYEVIDRNYYKKWGEIDIICQKDGSIHFVEVKSVISDYPVLNSSSHRPEDNVHNLKLRHMRRAIESYLWEKNVSDTIPIKIDVVCVHVNKEMSNSICTMIEDIII